LIFLQSAGGYDDMQGVQSGGYKTDKGVTRKCEVTVCSPHEYGWEFHNVHVVTTIV